MVIFPGENSVFVIGYRNYTNAAGQGTPYNAVQHTIIIAQGKREKENTQKRALFLFSSARDPLSA